jgi:thioredoxin-related protein
MRKLVWAILLGPLFAIGQGRGVVFLQNLSWQDILKTAKLEHKYIFIDCYASWCGPCKWMDQNVYQKDSVGEIMNNIFLAIRIQMDSTKQDGDDVRRWYEIAHDFGIRYQIHSYPSYLFLSPDGDLVHKAVGSMDTPKFISLLEEAIDPKKQYYTLLYKYEKGLLSYQEMPYLANAAKNVRDDSLSHLIADDYMHHYLGKLPSTRLWTKENIQFVDAYKNIIAFNDLVFQRYLGDKNMIDSIMDRPGYSYRLINYVAYNQEVDPQVKTGIANGIEPHWLSIEKALETKYGHGYVEKNILKGRVEYYKMRKEWTNYVKYFVKQIELSNVQNWPKSGFNIIALNNDAFEIFKYSNDKKELEKGLSLIDKALSMEDKPGANEMDTRANLLYKLGRKREALTLEEESRNLAPEDKVIEATYDKMKNNLPTW